MASTKSLNSICIVTYHLRRLKQKMWSDIQYLKNQLLENVKVKIDFTQRKEIAFEVFSVSTQYIRCGQTVKAKCIYTKHITILNPPAGCRSVGWAESRGHGGISPPPPLLSDLDKKPVPSKKILCI